MPEQKEQLNYADVQRLQAWLQHPNGSLHLGKRTIFEAVQGGGILTRLMDQKTSPTAACKICGKPADEYNYGPFCSANCWVRQGEPFTPSPETMRGALVNYLDWRGNRKNAVALEDQPDPGRVKALPEGDGTEPVWLLWEDDDWVEDSPTRKPRETVASRLQYDTHVGWSADGDHKLPGHVGKTRQGEEKDDD